MLLRPEPPVTYTHCPSGEKAMPSGLMPAPEGAKPLTKAPAPNGSSTVVNADGLDEGAGLGTPCWAARNSALLDGCVGGAGGVSVLVCCAAHGRVPRLICGS